MQQKHNLYSIKPGETNMSKCFKYFMQLFLLTFSTICLAAPITIVPNPPELDVKAYVLIDFNSGKVIAEKESQTRIDPASLTKMMTMYVIDHELRAGHISEDSLVDISKHAWKTKGSRMFIEVGKQVKVGDLIRGIVIQSGNDASVALAEYIAGSEESFAALMNQYAKRLGMTQSNFVNSTGMPNNDHYTTARDLSILSRALISHFPETYKLYSEKWFTFNGIKQPNRNRLLWREPYIDGIKTGHSDSAGYCLAASGEKDGMRLISVVVGSKNDNERTDQTQQLLRYGFRFFETHKLFDANKAINNHRIWMGEKDKMAFGIENDLYVTIPYGQLNKLNKEFNLDRRLKAPLSKGEKHGTLAVKLGDEVVAQRPLITLDSVSEGTIWKKFSDYISISLDNMIGGNKKAEES
jgi:D-alanyl-D-alanine carboxypeptidase (penicillin-binding protein 5/6)